MKRDTQFKYGKNSVVKTHNLPDILLERGLKNNHQFQVKYGPIRGNESPSYYVTVVGQIVRLQSTDGLLTGFSKFFEVVK
jgi:hypothetical protein